MQELLEIAGTPSVSIRAVGAHFDVKEALKARGYRWDGVGGVWCKAVLEAEMADEGYWLCRNVYSPEFRPRADGPATRSVTWRERHL